MKKALSKHQGSTLFLKFVILLIAVAVFVLCVIVLSMVVRGNANLYNPILLGMLIPAIPFFIALYQAFKLLGYIENGKVFSNISVKALKNIKYCGFAISLLYVIGMPYVFYVVQKDDNTGVIAIGCVVIFASVVIATAAAVFEKLLQNAVDIKSENDLTV